METSMKLAAAWRCSMALLFLAVTVDTRADLLVLRPGGSGFAHTAVLRFDEANGSFINEFSADSEGFAGLTIGPDKRVYVTGNILGFGDIFRFTSSGTVLGKFGGANLTVPGGLKFGPDGNLYATSIVFPSDTQQGQVLRYHGTNGTFLNPFIPAGTGGLATPQDLIFCDNGFLYILDSTLGILRYQATNGEFDSNFIPLGRGGLSDPSAIACGFDKHIYVASATGNSVLRFHSDTGAFLNTFVASGSGGLDRPAGLAFGPDGRLYISSFNTHSILRYDGTNGAFLNTFIAPGTGGLFSPTALAFSPRSPRLSIIRTGVNVIFLWPTNFFDFQLTGTTNLTTNWTSILPEPVITGANYVVTNTLATAARFYRLERP